MAERISSQVETHIQVDKDNVIVFRFNPDDHDYDYILNIIKELFEPDNGITVICASPT